MKSITEDDLTTVLAVLLDNSKARLYARKILTESVLQSFLEARADLNSDDKKTLDTIIKNFDPGKTLELLASSDEINQNNDSQMLSFFFSKVPREVFLKKTLLFIDQEINEYAAHAVGSYDSATIEKFKMTYRSLFSSLST